MPSLLFVYALNVCLVEACFCLHADVGGKEWLKPQAGWIELSSEGYERIGSWESTNCSRIIITVYFGNLQNQIGMIVGSMHKDMKCTDCTLHTHRRNGWMCRDEAERER